MLYVGQHTFKGTEFIFTFDGHMLLFTPMQGEETKARSITMQKFASGWASPGRPILINAEYLVLHPSNLQTNLVIFPNSDRFFPLDSYCGSMQVGVRMYYELFSGGHDISYIDFYSPLLNRSYDVLNIIGNSSFNDNDHTLSLTTRSVDPAHCHFTLRDMEVKVSIFYKIKSRDKETHQPLSVSSVMRFDVGKTSDYLLVGELVDIATSYLRFIVQSKDVGFEEIELYRLKIFDSDEPMEPAGKSIITPVGNIVDYIASIDSGAAHTHDFYLPIGRGQDIEGQVLQALAENRLSTRHLVPLSKRRTWDFPRCVLLAASFDSTFSALYPHGVNHSKKTVKAIEYVADALSRIESNRNVSSTTRKTSQWLRGILESGDAFSSKLVEVWKNHSELICYQYEKYSSKDQFVDFSKRMERLRNGLAHGAIDVEVDEQIIRDVQFLERIVLCCQLLSIGINDSVVREIIAEATNPLR